MLPFSPASMALRLVLVCAAFGAIAAAAVSPANASTAVPGADGVYKLQLATGVNLTELAPLTTAAAQMSNVRAPPLVPAC